MDFPIAEKALFAQTRVQQALEAGAHCIDAGDVREALDGFKGALDCQFGVHNDLLARNNGLETQLFHCRVNAGGSEVLLSGAIKTRDRLVDYLRHMEEVVPFAKTAETRESGAAIFAALDWLIREAGSSRLAVQAVKANRNQLEAEAEELRGPADCHPDPTRTEYVCPECQAYERDGHEDGCQVGRMQTWDRDVLRDRALK